MFDELERGFREIFFRSESLILSILPFPECREIYLKILNVLSKSSHSVKQRKMDAVTGMWTELQKENK